MTKCNICFLGLVFFFLSACGSTGDNASVSTGVEPTAYETETKKANNAPIDELGITKISEESNDPTLIREGEFLGIRPGQSISGINNLKKDVLKTGEGKFQVYTLSENDGMKIGYITPGRRDQGKVGAIHITSKDYQTSAGIGVGNTFAELEAAYGNLSVHGSELEGRTYAVAGKLSFRLSAYNTSYELEKPAIKPQAKITEVVVE